MTITIQQLERQAAKNNVPVYKVLDKILQAMKEFEIDLKGKLYFGNYHFEGNRLVMDDVKTYDDNEQELRIDKNEWMDVYEALKEDKRDELNDYRDSLDWEIKYEQAEERWKDR